MGYGSQALALKYLGVEFEHWKICEWAVKSIQAYKDIHFTDDDIKLNESRTKNEMVEFLYQKGISNNYNDSMSKEQINRLSEQQLKTIIKNIAITHNLVNIQQVKGKDLCITDTDKFTYLLTYSFPCQDLSLAGKGKGMSDTSTRSGMLWEVERILQECKDLGNLPEVLLMENVPQVHGEGNTEDFNKWQLRLEELGYKNYWQDLIATDYGIPQTRNRTFMVSILGDYNYTFPKPIPLKLKLKDMLEDNVDEKYYLSDKCIKTMLKHDTDYKPTGLAPTLTTELSHHTGKNFTPKIIREIDYSLKIKNATKQGYLEATDGDGIDISGRMEHHRGTVQKDKIQTLTTQCDRGVVINNINNKAKHQQDIIQDSNGNTRTLVCGTHGNGGHYTKTLMNDLRIRKLTPRECFRLMGVKDEDFEKVNKNQSDSSLYHLAGDSIVVNVLMAIFGEMI